MLYLNLILRLPFDTKFRSLAYRDVKLSKHTAFECQLTWFPAILFNFCFDIHPTGDHRGIDLDLVLLGLGLHLKFYDSRHEDEV